VLLSSKGTDRAGMRIARWAERLLCFNYEVNYHPGSKNQVADYLSRLPLSASDDDFSDTEPEFVALLSSEMSAVSPTEFACASASCSEMTALRAQIVRGWPSSSAAVDVALRPYFQIRHELTVQKDYVFRGSRLVVPVALRCVLVNLAHEGHQGIVRTKQRIRELYWWPGIDCLVNEQIKNCEVCLSSDKVTTVRAAPLQPVPFPSMPWEKVAVDIVGPFETATWDCRYIMTLIDYHSKWPEVAFTSSITSKNVINFLTSVFSRFGNPHYIVSDNGCQFKSVEFAAFLKDRDIQHIYTSVYHPAANGAIERFHRVLKSAIQSAILSGKPWKSTVTEFLQTYRATTHSVTGLSPSELLCGRKMRTRLNVLPLPITCKDPDVRQKVSLSQKKMKVYTDLTRRACTPEFKSGDWVRIKIPVHVPKGHPRFSKPLKIVHQLGPCTYQLSDGKNWHASHLSPACAPMENVIESELVSLPLQSVPSSTVLPKDELVNLPNQVASPSVPVRSSSRVKRPPRWLHDYVT